MDDEPPYKPWTVAELQAVLATLPQDLLVFVQGYEHGLIAIKTVDDTGVFEQNDDWQSYDAPMMGTHDVEQARTPDDKDAFRAVVITRYG
jgi:hypothetical protein